MATEDWVTEFIQQFGLNETDARLVAQAMVEFYMFQAETLSIRTLMCGLTPDEVAAKYSSAVNILIGQMSPLALRCYSAIMRVEIAEIRTLQASNKVSDP